MGSLHTELAGVLSTDNLVSELVPKPQKAYTFPSLHLIPQNAEPGGPREVVLVELRWSTVGDPGTNGCSMDDEAEEVCEIIQNTTSGVITRVEPYPKRATAQGSSHFYGVDLIVESA